MISGRRFPGLDRIMQAARTRKESDVSKGWFFIPTEEIGANRAIGTIHKGSPLSPPVGEWTAWLYRAGEVTLQYLIHQDDRKEKGMRGLYQVTVVDPEAEEIVLDEKAIAASAESAKFKALKGTDIEDLETFDIIVVRLGDIRPRKEVQEVKIVGG